MPPPESTCNSCKAKISNREAIFNCVGCGLSLHMKPECVGISNQANIGLMEISQNILTFCNDCVKNNQKDKVLYKIASHQDDSSTSHLAEKVENEIKSTAKNHGDQMQKVLEVVDEIKGKISTIGSEMKKAPTVPEPNNPKTRVPTKKQANKENCDGIRLRGIPEMDSENARERLEDDTAQVADILSFLQIECPITDLKRIGPFDKDKTRTIVIKLANEHQKRLVLLSAHKLAKYKQKLYLSKELTQEEQTLENKALKLRRELIDKGTQANLLRIRNLKL